MKTTLFYYHFDISKTSEKAEYKALCEKLSNMGLSKFDCTVDLGWARNFEPLNGKSVTLFSETLFNNQWNSDIHFGDVHISNGTRLFDWFECIYDNNKIKCGYWLEQTLAMREIRQKTFRCDYCGTKYKQPEKAFCTACLGDENLKESQLELLQLHPVATENDYTKKFTPPADLLALYRTRQHATRSKKLAELKAAKLIELQKAAQAHEIEQKAFKLLIENDQDFENVIYYSHSGKFCFGWQNPYTKDLAACLKDVLTEIKFPYPYDIKTLNY